MLDLNTEKKLGRVVLETITQISENPRDNVRRFMVLNRNLKRAVKAYKAYTGSDYLLGKTPAYYGLEVAMGKTEQELIKGDQERRNGNESE